MSSRCIGWLSHGTRSDAPQGVTLSEIAVSERSSIDIGSLEDHSEDFSIEAARNRKSLRASICLKLTIFVGFLVVLASGIPALVLWLKANEQLVEEIDRRLLTVSTLRQEQLKEYLTSDSEKAGLSGSRVIINKYLANQTANNRTLAEFDLRSAVSVIADFLHAAVYDSEGGLVLSTATSGFANVLWQKDMLSIQSNRVQFGYPRLTPTGWVYNISLAILKLCRSRETRVTARWKSLCCSWTKWPNHII